MAGKGISYEWSSLPADIVHLISTKLHDLSDLARLRTVCKTWRSAINPLSSPPSPCLPWLVACHATDDGEICYYSLSSNKTYKIQVQLPLPERAYFLSAAGGRLLCCQDRPCCTRSPSLFNPLTGLAVALPPLDDHIVNLTIVSSLDPSQEEEFVAISGADSLISHTFVGIVRPGHDDEAWEPIPLSVSYHGSVRVYHEGLYYINHDLHEHTWIFNTVGEMVAEVPCHEMFSRAPIAQQYILASCGEILVILRHFSDKLEDVSFSIFRLDRAVNGEYDYQWVEVRDIGDQMLFLHFGTGFSLPSSDFAGFKGNCIYFLEDESFYFPDSEGERKYSERPAALLRRHDLANGATESLPNFYGNWGTWFFPKFV